MDRVDYDARQHAVYRVGRRMSPGALETWMGAFSRHLPRRRPLAWVDIGSGTGRMTPSLAATFGGPAYGIEPSARMREEALAHAAHPGVSYTAGCAERLGLPDAACDAALAFFVWHHVADPQAAARELHRVVKPGGTLFVQANFSDRSPGVWWLDVVPEWDRIHATQFCPEAAVREDVTRAGWTVASRDEVTWERSSTLAEDLERLRLRSVSLFEYLSEEEATAGFARIEAVLPSLDPGPQMETSALLVLRH
jgi:SAM-dependent methyltransferase